MYLKVDVEGGKVYFKKSKDGPEDKYFVHNKSMLNFITYITTYIWMWQQCFKSAGPHCKINLDRMIRTQMQSGLPPEGLRKCALSCLLWLIFIMLKKWKRNTGFNRRRLWSNIQYSVVIILNIWPQNFVLDPSESSFLKSRVTKMCEITY